MSSDDVPKLRLPVGEKRDHIQGSASWKVTLLEYGDYQCPFCGEAYPIIKKVQQKFGDDLRFVFRNFPLTEVHPFAETGAEIAEAAAAQGKFWEMHDHIYENQRYLSNFDYFVGYAEKTLGLNGSRIREEVGSRAYTPRIKEDFMSGIRSGVNGTPTFFINDLRHNDDYEYEVLVEAIELAMGRKKPAEKKMVVARAPRQTRRG
ncbi:MAG: DsbA family protein [Thaumarchaeota archaeon]|nr:DsbA family protein [Nitrososphaerota archaeon]